MYYKWGVGGLHHGVAHSRAHPTIKEFAARCPDVPRITQSGVLGNETDTNDELILFPLIPNLKHRVILPMEGWVTHSERLMTKTLKCPLDDCDCSAEQTTMLTNAEAKKKKKEKEWKRGLFIRQGKHRRRASGDGESAAKWHLITVISILFQCRDDRRCLWTLMSSAWHVSRWQDQHGGRLRAEP